MNHLHLSYLLVLFSVFISAVAQILLKKSANRIHEKKIYEYLNGYVICAYLILFSAMLINVFALKYVPVSAMPILESTSYLYVALFGVVLFKEKLTRTTKIGLTVIFLGVILYFI